MRPTTPCIIALSLAAACATGSRVPAPGTTAGSSVASTSPSSLRTFVDSMIDVPEFRSAHWGILIVDPGRGHLVRFTPEFLAALQSADGGQHQHTQRVHQVLCKRWPARRGVPQHHQMHGQRHRPRPPAAARGRAAQVLRAVQHTQGEQRRMAQHRERELAPTQPR